MSSKNRSTEKKICDGSLNRSILKAKRRVTHDSKPTTNNSLSLAKSKRSFVTAKKLHTDSYSVPAASSSPKNNIQKSPSTPKDVLLKRKGSNKTRSPKKCKSTECNKHDPTETRSEKHIPKINVTKSLYHKPALSTSENSPHLSKNAYSKNTVTSEKIAKLESNPKTPKPHAHHEPSSPTSDHAMEIDLDVTDKKNDSTDTGNLLAIIVDTNILIKDINLLEGLKQKQFNGLKIIIVIPYTTIQELDDLKQIKPSAQKAIKWCNRYFENGNSYVQGQGFEDYLEAAATYGGTNADDKIRDCCLFYKKKGYSVCLLSDDVNLRNKAILSNLQVIDSDTLLKNLSFGSLYLQSHVEHDKSFKTPQLEQGESSIDAAVLEESSIDKSTFVDKPFEKDKSKEKVTLASLKESLKQTLNPIIEDAMEDSYGSLWVKIVAYDPPWNANIALRCIERHWIAVFMDKFPNHIKDCAKVLYDLLSSEPSDDDEIEKLNKQVSTLYKMFEKTKYKHLIKPVIYTSAKPVFASLDGIKNDSCQKSDFQNIILTLGTNVSKVCNVLFEEIEFSGMTAGSSTSLINLKNTLVSLGSTLLRLLNDPTLESLKAINDELENYWNCAKDPGCFQAFKLEDLNLLLKEDKCKALLLSCTREFEKIINRINTLD